MTIDKQAENTSAFNVSPVMTWLVWGAAFVLLCLVFRIGLEEMVDVWLTIEEYSHGVFIPCITLYFIWLRRSELRPVSELRESVPGLVIFFIGLLVFVPGSLAALYAIEQYAYLIAITGLFAVIFGVKGLKLAATPLFFLIFMVPFPAFIISTISSKLQLVSSWFGVEFIRLCDIMVYLEGNVIDLGGYKLQVVDACSGLRYLFPLSSLAFLCAYLFKGPFWQKLLVFLSSAPLTVFMNSFRIGVIGIMVNYWGVAMAEGFLHDFEGWAVFLLCMVLLFIEMWLLSGGKTAIGDLVQIPNEWGGGDWPTPAGLNRSALVVFGLLLLAGGMAEYYRDRVDIIPKRAPFLNFPLEIAGWHGKQTYLERAYLDQLNLTDYALIDFYKPGERDSVNFYSAYYQTQRKGATIHSPRSCIPGGGWQITKFEEMDLPDLLLDGAPIKVSRAVVEKDETRQLVYFWFYQRGRNITNEYVAKWYLLYDAITMNRTDGALIRLTTTLNRTEDASAADRRLQDFLRVLLPQLPPYLPGKHALP